jgi:hypothetical protein
MSSRRCLRVFSWSCQLSCWKSVPVSLFHMFFHSGPVFLYWRWGWDGISKRFEMCETHSQLWQHLAVAAGTVYHARCPANTKIGEKLTLAIVKAHESFNFEEVGPYVITSHTRCSVQHFLAYILNQQNSETVVGKLSFTSSGFPWQCH